MCKKFSRFNDATFRRASAWNYALIVFAKENKRRNRADGKAFENQHRIRDSTFVLEAKQNKFSYWLATSEIQIQHIFYESMLHTLSFFSFYLA